MAVTLAEIAALAGVSRGTVDRALNNRGRVDAKVAARVRHRGGNGLSSQPGGQDAGFGKASDQNRCDRAVGGNHVYAYGV